MKSFVIDANIIFSALISGKETYLETFSAQTFLLPDYAFDEISEYQELILKKTKLPSDKLKQYSLKLFSTLTVVPNILISNNSYYKAFQYCKDVDEKDTVYIALSIEFDIPLISKDEKLVDGLRAKGYKNIISLKEFFEQSIK